MAKQLGILCTAGDIDLFDAASAEEMFLTSTSLRILPVKSFNGGPSPTAGHRVDHRKLIDAYAKSVGCISWAVPKFLVGRAVLPV